MQTVIDNVLIIGVGLIGGSIAKGLKERRWAGCVTGFNKDPESLASGINSGVLDRIAENLDEAIAEADLIVIAVPTLAVSDYLDIIGQHRKKTAVVTDVASVKGQVAEAITDYFGVIPPWFILGHPIAGSEKSGIDAANSDLFVGHKVILTSLESSSENALHQVTSMWQILGADVADMPIAQHDIVLAATSHLPHLLAFTLVDCLQDLDVNVDVFRFAAGGFRDFTRIAGSDPEMWHDIMMANKSSILTMLNAFNTTLKTLECAVKNDDSDAVFEAFTRAKSAREHFQKLIDNK